MMQSKKGFANLVHAQNWLDDAIFSEKMKRRFLWWIMSLACKRSFAEFSILLC
jgi:hypothetical protein